MFGKLIKFLLLCAFTAIVFSVASIAGVRNDIKKDEKLAMEEEMASIEEAQAPQEVASPFLPFAGGVLELEMDYDVQIVGKDVYVSVLSNLPDGFDLSAELSNTEAIKKQLGFENISASAMTPEQMNQINELAYYSKEKNFVVNGVCTFMFSGAPSGQLDINVTSPITKFQPAEVQSILGEQGANLQGSYVVFLEEVADKSINFTASFVVSEDEL